MYGIARWRSARAPIAALPGSRALSVLVLILGVMGNDIPPRLMELARFQAGVVSRRQAMHVGMSPSSITAKVTSGRWRHLHLGVYATFTGPVTRDASLWAALLYAGNAAQLFAALRARGYRGTLKPCSAACTARAGRRDSIAVAGPVRPSARLSREQRL
jgi:hypothetical protein